MLPEWSGRSPTHPKKQCKTPHLRSGQDHMETILLATGQAMGTMSCTSNANRKDRPDDGHRAVLAVCASQNMSTER